MRIVVCIKQVPGTNEVHLDPDTRTMIREAKHAIINPYDAFAVELAVQLKQACGAETIALSMGIPATEKILRDTLCRGIDQAILLTDRAFAGADTWATAYTLSLAMRRIGPVDLILCGKMAIDGDTAQTGPELAECLGLTAVTDVMTIRTPDQGQMSVRQMIAGGYRDLQVHLPALLTIAKDACIPRLPSIAGIRQASEKTVRHWTAAILAADRQKIGRNGSPTQVIETFTPELARPSETLSGGTAEQAAALSRVIRDWVAAKSTAKSTENITLNPEQTESSDFASLPQSTETVGLDSQGCVLTDANQDAVEPGGIWVYAEVAGQQVQPVTFELLGCARRLAAEQSRRQVTAVLCGDQVAVSAASLVLAGADTVLLCDDAVMAGLPEDECTDLLTELAQKHQPEILLFGATRFGRAVAPRLAARLQTGLTADCTLLQLQPDTGLLLQTRPAFGGNLMATIVTERHRPQMATVRPGVMPRLAPDRRRCGRIVQIAPPLPCDRVSESARVIQAEEPGIAQADVIVSAGRGIASQKNLVLVQELADLLNGQYGVSRPLVDMGWADSRCQIGQTGQAVSPRLLIACGISGAIQHLAGIGGAQKIIAINTDPQAPILAVADYRVVGDCLAILPQLIRDLRGRSGDLLGAPECGPDGQVTLDQANPETGQGSV